MRPSWLTCKTAWGSTVTYDMGALFFRYGTRTCAMSWKACNFSRVEKKMWLAPMSEGGASKVKSLR